MSVIQYDYQKKLDELLSTGKKRSYFVGAVTVFFILLMSIAGIIPALGSLGTQHQDNIARDALIGKLQTKLDTLKGFVSEQDSKAATIAFLDNIFPEKFPEKDTLNKLVALATKDQVDITAYNFQAGQTSVQEAVNVYASVNTKAIVVTLAGSGLLSDIQNFIKDCESSSRIINFTDVVITRKIDAGSEQASADNGFTLDATAVIYYYDTTASATN